MPDIDLEIDETAKFTFPLQTFASYLHPSLISFNYSIYRKLDIKIDNWNLLMIISSLMMNTSPGKLDQVQKEIATYGGVEISSIINDEKIQILVSCSSEEEKDLILKKIEKLDGVLGMNFVYEYFEKLCDRYWENPQKIVPMSITMTIRQ